MDKRSQDQQRAANFSYFSAPPDQWSILGYYQFRRLQNDFSGLLRKEKGCLKSTLQSIAQNSSNFNNLQIRRAQSLLNDWKGQHSNSKVVAFWNEIDHLEMKQQQIKIARADGVLHIIEATNKSQRYATEIQHQDLLDLQILHNSRGAKQKRDEKVDDELAETSDEEGSQRIEENKIDLTTIEQPYPPTLKTSAASSGDVIEETQENIIKTVKIMTPLREPFVMQDAILPCTNNDTECEIGVKDLELFTKRFEKMICANKWHLKSGRAVEDVLYEIGKKCKYHNLVHSFIIDSEDDYVRSHFTKEELDEIVNENHRAPPDLDPNLLQFVSTFAKSSTVEIREQLNLPHLKLGRDYNPKMDFAYHHVKATIADWLMLLESQPNPLILDLPEAWYRTNVWRCIDIAFSDVPYVFVVGGERAGIAGTERKNKFRTMGNYVQMQRKAVGKKGDGYVRSVGPRLIDWAASEAGPYWEGEKGTKTFRECGLHLPRQLKDIFMSLARRVDFNEEKLRALDVVGFIHAGAVLVKTNLDCPKGYVCRYTKDAPCELYADIKQFDKSLDILVTVLYAKSIIMRTMRIVNDASERAEEKALARWKSYGKTPKRKTCFADIPDCHPTPKKNRVKDIYSGPIPKLNIEQFLKE